mmetsp:Transcript_45444/g.108464  ORF Transcript_45444/g.108464 Transcript_45444/m.108464 type:complete len:80 (+) Transcript_45444:134-373(+)
MAKGLLREKAQARAQQRDDAAKGGISQKGLANKALQIICPQCKTAMPKYGMFKVHWESKHSGDVPPESTFEGPASPPKP